MKETVHEQMAEFQGLRNVCFRKLMKAIVVRALNDLRNSDIRQAEKNRAMKFILGLKCQTYCAALNLDYKIVRKQAAAWYRQYPEYNAAENFQMVSA
jgi:hypothetical protein